MADFGTILNPSNTTLDLYCRSVNQSSGNPFCVIGTCAATQTLTSNQKIPLQFANSQSSTFNQITINNDLNLLTITKPGAYLADLSLSTDLAAEAGSQSVLSVVLNTGSVFCDVGYGSPSQFLNVKLTSKVVILVLPNAPTTIQYFIQNTSTSASSNFRYAQLSITKLQ
jgi:hypothetical protein